MKYIMFALLIALLPAATEIAREEFVSGRVVDAANGMSMPGATVVWKNTIISTVTDKDGNFSIEKTDKSNVLVVNYVGYETREVRIQGATKKLEVKLKAAENRLEEVVVSALGVARSLQDTEQQEYNTEDYSPIVENRFRSVRDEPLSTFSIDVDDASYSNARRFLNNGQLPPAGAVRVEEFINYFHYDYPQPNNEHPFSINTELANCPWNEEHKLVMVGLQGRKIATNDLPPSNLVFLIDVSGSMQDENKLPLVKSSIKLLVDQLREEDMISLVVYAGNAGLVLPSTSGANKQAIKDAVESLEAGGSTAGGAGIRLAYSVARQNFLQKGNNRVILCTDGDFNVGVSSDAELVRIIEHQRKSGVFLTVLGYGMGNYKDNKMQQLANKGNGNHSYIDNINEAKKVLVNEFGGTLFTIAKDVKLQVEFNPAKVQGYRLIGYENRLLNNEDFNDDDKDAGEIGSGHTVTAVYEIIPVGVRSKFVTKFDPLKYQKRLAAKDNGNDLMTIKFRYKEPDGNKSKLLEHIVSNETISNTSDNFRFVAAVAQFGMLLSNSTFKQGSSFESVKKLAEGARETDIGDYTTEFLQLVTAAEKLMTDSETQAKNK